MNRIAILILPFLLLGGCGSTRESALHQLAMDSSHGASHSVIHADEKTITVATRADAVTHDYTFSAQLFVLAALAVAGLLYAHLMSGPWLLIPEGLGAASIALVVHAWVIEHTGLVALLVLIVTGLVVAIFLLKGKGTTLIGGVYSRLAAWIARTEHEAVSWIKDCEGHIFAEFRHVTGKVIHVPAIIATPPPKPTTPPATP